jgi:hypothetical protein
MTQGIQKQRWRLPTIEAKRHLVKICGEMFRADSVPCPHDAALQKRESRLNGIGVNLSVHIDAALVLDSLVLCGWNSSAAHGISISGEFIGNEYVYIFANVLLDVLRQCAGFRIRNMEEPKITATLPDSDDNLFGFFASVNAISDLLPANIGFVHLYGASQHLLIVFLHSGPNAMAEVPRCLVADSQGALHLISGEPLSRFYEKQDSDKPLAKGKMGVIENRSDRDGKLVIAIGAPQQLDVAQAHNTASLASRTFRAKGPAQPFQDFPAFIIGREQFCNFRESHNEYPV